MIKVGVLGARGRMGAEVVKAVTEASDLELVTALDLGDSLDQLKSNRLFMIFLYIILFYIMISTNVIIFMIYYYLP